MTKPDLSFAIGLPPEAAIRYFEGKGLKLTGDWRELWQEQHAKAFTVARLAKMDVLKDIHDAINDALKGGTTERDFIKRLTPILQAKGWWGPAIDKKTGEVLESYDGSSRPVEWGSPRRLKLIYRQNTQTAYMAGRYKQQRELGDSGARPYWQYVAVMDSRTRPSHAALHGRVWRYDDPIWDYLYPPNGWNCRCRVRALTEAQVKKMGLTVESSDGQLITRQVQAGKRPDGSPDMRDVTGIRIIDRDGRESVMLPDAGWDYNPGRAWLGGLLDGMAEKARALPQGPLQDALGQVNMELAEGGIFDIWRARPEAAWPLAILSAEKAMDSSDPLIYLTPESLAGLEQRRPELSAQDYASVQRVIQQATAKSVDAAGAVYLRREGDMVSFVLVRREDGRLILDDMGRMTIDQATRDERLGPLLGTP